MFNIILAHPDGTHMSLLESVIPYALLVAYVVVTLVGARYGSRLVVRIARKLGTRRNLPTGLLDFISSILRGLIWLVAASLVVAEASLTFGLQQTIMDSISNFVTANAARFGVMLVMIVGAYIALRIFGIAFSEYKRRSKMHPLTLDLFDNVVHYLVYAVVAVLLLTNLLVMAGLQTIAGTLVTLFTVFIGLVVSFAATGSIGNALSGLVVMSWRPFREGDRVEVGGGVYGDVLEVDIMFTRIRTIKQELVHIPNSQILSNKIVNYSALGKVIVHYEVTIGYDVPHEKVENLLLAAAKETTGLLQDPRAFVLIRNLDNNFVSYEINAYTDQPNQLVTTYSNLMKTTLDVFADAGIEILSPKHVAIRKSELTVNRERKMAKKK
jgi:small-conductance mechanosensitive channel